MLHAVYHNKGNLYKRYIRERDGLEGNVYAEDEITSIFLGTQEFLETAYVWQIWRAIVGEEINPPNQFQPPESATIQLWPRRGIEPDAMITFCWPNKVERLLLVEFKWDAPESGVGQLQKQWTEFLTDKERQNALHLFIAKDTSPARTHLDQWNIYPITWLQVRSRLQTCQRVGKLETFCKLMDHFFHKIGIHPFCGFSGMQASPEFLDTKPPQIFFSATGNIEG